MVTAAPTGSEHRVAAAMRAHPLLVAGSDRLDTVLMTSLPGSLSKVGAEGVLAAALPDGAALAVKVADGGGRAVGPVLLEVLRRRGWAISGALAALADPPIRGGGYSLGDHSVRS
jgi:L-asparaginase II